MICLLSVGEKVAIMTFRHRHEQKNVSEHDDSDIKLLSKLSLGGIRERSEYLRSCLGPIEIRWD